MSDMVPNDGKPTKRRRGRKITEADLGLFLQQYGRKAQSGWDPNDRGYSREIEQKLKRMRPEDLDRLMRGDELNQ
jgi:hypothetical protein